MLNFLCISLNRSKERAKLISRQVDALDANVEFFEAVDGSLITYGYGISKGYNRAKRLQFNNELSINEVACSLSHLGAIRKFLDSNYEHVVVIEDDVIIDSRIVDFINDFVEKCDGWDVLKLEHRPCKKNGITIGCIRGIQVIIPRRPGFGAAGMLYNKAGARKILRAYSNFHKAFDSQFVDSWRHGIRIVQIYPGLVYEADADESTVGKRREKKVINSKTKKFAYMLDKLLSSIMKRFYSIYVFFVVKIK